MSRRKDLEKGKNVPEVLPPEESREVEMILDRLEVQDPEGESLPGYLESLRKALAGRETLAAALIERLGRKPGAVGFRAFLALRDLYDSRNYRRLTKQVAYRFAQKGYSTEEQAQAAEQKPVVLVQKEERKPLAHFIPAKDVLGVVGVLVPGDTSSYSWAIYGFIMHGFRQSVIKVVESTNKAYREFLQHLSSGQVGGGIYEIPVWHAARLLFDTMRLGEVEQAGGESFSSGEAGEAGRLLKPFYDPERLPYAYDLMPPVDEPQRRLSEIDGKGLLESFDFRVVLFSEDVLRPYFEKLMGVQHSTLIVSPAARQERAEEIVRQATEELCAGEMREYYRRFFEELALRHKLSGMDDLAMSAWIAAQHLRLSPQVAENPVMHMLLHLSLEFHWEREFQEGEGAEEPKGPFVESESGLIVPR